MSSMPTPCAIFDLDGTLADVRHRLHLIHREPPDWEGFFAACGADPPHDYAVRLARAVAAYGIPVMIVSGRPERNRLATAAWLVWHDVPHRQVLLRADDDRRPDTVVKGEALERLRRQGYEPLFAIDDRPSVVRFWRDAGIPCLAADDAEWATPQASYDGVTER